MAEKEVRLIDANALEKALEEITIPVAVVKGKMFRLIKEAPTINPESLRPHGKWFPDPHDWICSKCGKWLELADGNADMNYCPHCGAKMEDE